MISIEEVAARSAPLALANVSWSAGAGVHALVGGSESGGLLLLRLIAGAARPRSGRVRVLGRAPTEGAVRAQVAYVPRPCPLPSAMTVAEVLALASIIRGEPHRPAAERLRTLGVEALASRSVDTLSREETRAVAVAEAATSTRVRVLLIEEPFLDLDARSAPHLPSLLRARSQDGCAVVIATSSMRDASEIADDCVLLRGGSIVGPTASVDGQAVTSALGVRLRIVASDARVLASALSAEEGVDAVARRDGAVIVRGQDTLQVARAASRAILASGVNVSEIRLQPPQVDELSSAKPSVTSMSSRGRWS